jgi:hypothetical protein
MHAEEWKAFIAAQKRVEMRRQRRRVNAAFDAINRNNVDDLGDNFGGDLFPWEMFFPKVVNLQPELSNDIRMTFLGAWVEHKSISLWCSKLPFDALRLLLPPYEGPEIQLFRGTTVREHERARYGLSWTADIAIAEKFATGEKGIGPMTDEVGVVLRTLALPEAVLCDVDKNLPFDH